MSAEPSDPTRARALRVLALALSLAGPGGCAVTGAGGGAGPGPAANPDPADARAWFDRGNRAVEAGDLALAERAFGRAVAASAAPSSTAASAAPSSTAASAAPASGADTEAPLYARALHNLGLVRLRLGLDDLRRALASLPPGHPAQARSRELVRQLLARGL